MQYRTPSLAGTTSVNIPVTVLGDQVVEPVETFTGSIVMSNANGQQVTIATGTATGTITDNDVASIAIADVSVAEDVPGGRATFTVVSDG